MYHAVKIQVKEKAELFSYCEQVCHAANNLYNAALFRCRQVMTAVTKAPFSWTDNEKEVMREIDVMFENPLYAKKYQRTTEGKYVLSYRFMDALLSANSTPDFFSEDISKQSPQQMLKLVGRDMKAFLMAVKAYWKNPAAFTGKPKLPHYKKSGGMS